MENLIQVGTILSAHGLTGEVKIRLKVDLKSPDTIRAFFIEQNGLVLPFLVLSFRHFRETTYLLKVEEITTKEAADNYRSTPLFLPEYEIEVDEEGWQTDIGKQVYFLNENKIGTISEVIPSGSQELLLVIIPTIGQIRLPAEESFFIEIPEENTEGVFKVELPDQYWETFIEELHN